jgi:hypothetical protein
MMTRPNALAQLLMPFIQKKFDVVTRRTPLQLIPSAIDNQTAGNCVFNITAAGAGPASVRWLSTGSNVTNKWLAATGQIPMDYWRPGSIYLKARMRAAASLSITNWQLYLTTLEDGNGDTWYIAGPDTIATIALTTNYQTIVLKNNPGLPASTKPGSFISVSFGPGGTATSGAHDVYLADMWLEYQSKY